MTTKVDIVFDAQADIKKAREFLAELGQQGLEVQIVGVSQAGQSPRHSAPWC